MCVACALIPAVISAPFGLFGLFFGEHGNIDWFAIAVLLFGVTLVLTLLFEEKLFEKKKSVEKEKKNKK